MVSFSNFSSLNVWCDAQNPQAFSRVLLSVLASMGSYFCVALYDFSHALLGIKKIWLMQETLVPLPQWGCNSLTSPMETPCNWQELLRFYLMIIPYQVCLELLTTTLNTVKLQSLGGVCQSKSKVHTQAYKTRTATADLLPLIFFLVHRMLQYQTLSVLAAMKSFLPIVQSFQDYQWFEILANNPDLAEIPHSSNQHLHSGEGKRPKHPQIIFWTMLSWLNFKSKAMIYRCTTSLEISDQTVGAYKGSFANSNWRRSPNESL